MALENILKICLFFLLFPTNFSPPKNGLKSDDGTQRMSRSLIGAIEIVSLMYMGGGVALSNAISVTTIANPDTALSV